jgi:hypothetical protein
VEVRGTDVIKNLLTSLQFWVAVLVGWAFGQRFAHKHPIGSVSAANGGPSGS